MSGGPQQIAIPASVIGDSVDVATELLSSEQYGFEVVTESQQDAEIPAGTVIATRPEPGSLVARGSTVTLVVSSGPGQVTVPPVVGNTEAAARNSLATNDLQASVEYSSLQPGDPNDGLVVSQNVAPGTAGRSRHGRRPRRRARHRAGHDDVDDDDHDDAATRDDRAAHDDAPALTPTHDSSRRGDGRRHTRWVSGGAGEEVAQQVVAGGGEDALGVELHALDLVFTVTQAHHRAVDACAP